MFLLLFVFSWIYYLPEIFFGIRNKIEIILGLYFPNDQLVIPVDLWNNHFSHWFKKYLYHKSTIQIHGLVHLGLYSVPWKPLIFY